MIGTAYNIYHVCRPPDSDLRGGKRSPERVDYAVSALWVGISAPVFAKWISAYARAAVHSDRHTMPLFNNRPPHSLASVLPSSLHPHPPHRSPSNLLARNPYHSASPRPPHTTCNRLGCRGNDDVCEPERANLGDEQPVVGKTHSVGRARHRGRRGGWILEEVGWG
jgi:hypothetical protein